MHAMVGSRVVLKAYRISLVMVHAQQCHNIPMDVRREVLHAELLVDGVVADRRSEARNPYRNKK